MQNVLDHSPARAVEQVVVGIPGIVDYEQQGLQQAPNLPAHWEPMLTADWLQNQLGIPVCLANDADLAAVGEAWFGAARNYQDMIYVTVSTGVGGGAVLGGRLVKGRYSAGEIGHTLISRPFLGEDKPVTVESAGSGSAITQSAQRAGLVERDSALADMVRQGHSVATKIWDDAVDAISVGIVNMAWMLSPQIVVIGGGVGVNADLIIGRVHQALDRFGPTHKQPIKVVGASLGDDAALVGAARWGEATGGTHE